MGTKKDQRISEMSKWLEKAYKDSCNTYFLVEKNAVLPVSLRGIIDIIETVKDYGPVELFKKCGKSFVYLGTFKY